MRESVCQLLNRNDNRKRMKCVIIDRVSLRSSALLSSWPKRYMRIGEANTTSARYRPIPTNQTQLRVGFRRMTQQRETPRGIYFTPRTVG